MGPFFAAPKNAGLSQGAQLVFIHQGALNLLPIEAAVHEAGGAMRYAVEDYTVSFAPSLAALSESRSRSECAGKSRSVLALFPSTEAFPASVLEKDFLATALEAGTATSLTDGSVTLERLTKEAAGQTHVHFAGHGFSIPKMS